MFIEFSNSSGKTLVFILGDRWQYSLADQFSKSQQTEYFIVFIVCFQLHMEKKLLNSLNENNNVVRDMELLPYWTLFFKHLFLPADWTLPYVLRQYIKEKVRQYIKAKQHTKMAKKQSHFNTIILQGQ